MTGTAYQQPYLGQKRTKLEIKLLQNSLYGRLVVDGG